MSTQNKKRFALSALSLAAVGGGIALLSSAAPRPTPRFPVAHAASKGSGALEVVDRDGRPGLVCPLKHTDVKAEITGFLARVNVTQEFENPLNEKIEAVYTFPLPNKAAVDDMTMHVGDRTVKGVIKERDEARRIFEDARNHGHVASLLDQERPNIFTQSVTNIMPGMKVKIEISYVETLPYEAGTYSFAFPMVVGPRYIPGQPTGRTGGGWAPDTDRVPDASKITPPVAPKGMRAGHDISLAVKVDAGVPIDALSITSHDAVTERPDARHAVVTLRNHNEIPNRDFVLKYDVAGRKIEDALLTHNGKRGGFFTFLLQPPERVRTEEVTPKEIVFVIDTSGSMSGFPLDKSKEVIQLALDNLNPADTFNLITFAGDTHILFPQPVKATAQNVRQAQQFLLSRQGGGGTEMMKAIRAALDPSDQQDHVRVVCFLTDGYVGNDMEIVGEVKRHVNARVFSFGIGDSVNRFLLDKMAEEGRGEVEYVSLKDDGTAAAKRFAERVRSPLLTDIQLAWNGLPVSDVYPKHIPDLFSAKPIAISGRFDGAARGTLRVRGKMAGHDYVRDIAVDLPANQPQHDVLATLWARNKVEDLMSQDWNGVQNGAPRGDIKQRIVEVGINFRLMTQFTSFVAVEEKIVTTGGVPTRVEVPVEMPRGVSHEGVFGDADAAAPAKVAFRGRMAASPVALPIPGFNSSAPRPTVFAEPEARAQQLEKKKEDSASKIDPNLLSRAGGETVKVKVWLSDASATVLNQLKHAGLTVRQTKSGKWVLGEIQAAKLTDLAKIGAVVFISQDLGTLE